MREALQAEDGPILIPAALLVEIDYMLRVKIGLAAEQRFLEGIEKGAFTVEAFTIEDAAFCRKLLARYEDLDLGLADASVIATAERLGIRTILTVDERDFRAVRLRRATPSCSCQPMRSEARLYFTAFKRHSITLPRTT